jgi:hypothetical protein
LKACALEKAPSGSHTCSHRLRGWLRLPDAHGRWTSIEAVAKHMSARTRVFLVGSGGHGMQLSVTA